MINMLGGNERSVSAFQAAKDKTIENLLLEDACLRFTMTDGTRMTLYDGGQSCCEARYFTTDDDLKQFIGAKLLDAEVREAEDVRAEDMDTHEINFLVVTTSEGTFTVKAHNEHNGYYGGFWIIARLEHEDSTDRSDARA